MSGARKLFAVLALVAICGGWVFGAENLNKNGENMSENVGKNIKEIYLAGGCFWGVEGYFERVKGVVDVDVGYANGLSESTSYQALALTRHAETARVRFDASKISLVDILRHFMRIIDPFSVNKQGNDVGVQYRSGIYYKDAADEAVIAAFLAREEAKAGKPFAIELAPLRHYILAEDYHQDYLRKHPDGYCHIDLNLATLPLDSSESSAKKH